MDLFSKSYHYLIQSVLREEIFIFILKQLDLIYASNIPIFLVLDEFQDIALIDEAEALFRNGLEHIHSQIPVVISGSKQHLLNHIFARPKAPFFNWGSRSPHAI